MLKKFSLSTLALVSTVVSYVLPAQAIPLIPYPNPGTPNPVTYIFTAATTGVITAYFAGSGAGYDESIGMLVNGVPTGIIGLNDHSSAIGASLVLGDVHAGDTLTFFDQVTTTGNTWYSNPAINFDRNGNHVYSIPYTNSLDLFGGKIPAGIYVGFEDLSFYGYSDYNYTDETFVFTNTREISSTPLPGALVLFGSGLLGLGAFALRRSRKVAAALAA